MTLYCTTLVVVCLCTTTILLGVPATFSTASSMSMYANNAANATECDLQQMVYLHYCNMLKSRHDQPPSSINDNTTNCTTAHVRQPSSAKA
jgi:hypothetical protein